MNEKFYSIGRGSLNINGKFYYGLDYQITDLMINLEQENKKLKEEKQELIDYLKEQINERKLTGNDEDYIKLDVYEEILSKIEKGVISNGMEELE